MRRFLRNLLHPDRYHGRLRGQKPPFFEGWYFKCVDKTEQHRFAFIPGVFWGERPHAFVQVLDGARTLVHYHEYPVDAFWAAEDRFEVAVGDNRFHQDGLTLAVDNAAQRVAGQLQFEGPVGWPVTFASPGIMGWYAWVPFMECYHGVVSLDHTIEGTLRYRGETLDFSGGRGYIEKDWGRNFPATWIWMQSNHFSHNGQPSPGTSLTASIARIPWIGRAFPGFIIGLWHERVLHRFTTYVGATMETVTVTGETVHCVVRNRTHRLELLTERAPGGLLYAPTPAGMAPQVRESVSAAITARLTTLDGRLLFEGRGSSAGLEVQGDTSILAP